MRKTRSGCVAQQAFCQECDWQYENQKNALALAAQHHDRTGHRVDVDIYDVVTYGEGPDERAADQEVAGAPGGDAPRR